jgi:hypothetical protein
MGEGVPLLFERVDLDVLEDAQDPVLALVTFALLLDVEGFEGEGVVEVDEADGLLPLFDYLDQLIHNINYARI